jgi:hypothetical protein
VVEVFESVPPPVTVHVTPPGVLSLATLAVRVTESVASTVAADDDTVTLVAGGVELPAPQPDRLSMANKVMAERLTAALDLRPKELNLFRNMRSPPWIGEHIVRPWQYSRPLHVWPFKYNLLLMGGQVVLMG